MNRASSPIDRAVVVVLDSVGVGELPDAADYGDTGANTLAHVAEAVGGLRLPNLERTGLGRIIPVSGVAAVTHPAASYGKMAEVSAGKDTTTGHWELMGVITERPFPTYPDGFPDCIIRKFESRIGRRTLGNTVASGTEIIQRLGDEHVRTGSPIVYTSADSVFQIACHEAVVPVEELYEICAEARRLLVDPHNVQRVIARPFEGESGSYIRTPRRRDFALEPPAPTLLDLVAGTGGEVVGIGKIEDVFAHRGVTTSFHTSSNADSISAIVDVLEDGRGRLVLANLVDFDTLYGHRNDAEGYARALREFDGALPEILGALREGDAFALTADHGCDPTRPGTDHTREYVPLLIYGPQLRPGVDLGVRSGFCDLAATLAEFLDVSGVNCGVSFARDLV